MAPPVAALLCLATFLLSTCLGQEATREIRIGVSLSLTGEFAQDYYGREEGKCTWCQDFKNAVELWEANIEGRQVIDHSFYTQKNERLILALDVMDDFGSLTKCIENYQQMMQYTDYFLGPAHARWGWLIKEMMEIAGKAVVLWAINPGVYDTPPFESTTDTAWLWQASQGMTGYTSTTLSRRLAGPDPLEVSQRMLGFADRHAATISALGRGQEGSPEVRKWLRKHVRQVPPAGLDLHNLSQWFLHKGAPTELANFMQRHLGTGGEEAPGQFSQQADVSEELAGAAERRRLSVSEWRQYWQNWNEQLQPEPDPTPNSYSLDVRVPEGSWAMHSLQQVYNLGARKFLFLYFADTADNVRSQATCEHYSKVAGLLGNDVWSYPYAAEYLSHFLLHLRVIRWADVDAIFLCGTGMTLLVTILGTEAMSINPKIFMSDAPYVLTSPSYTYARSHFLEPSPIPPMLNTDRVFKNLDNFITRFREAYPQTPGYAAVHAVGALTLMLYGFQNAPVLSPASVVQTIREADDHENFFGPFHFNATTGARKTNGTFTRQILPINAGAVRARSNCEDASTSEYTRAERFNYSRVVAIEDGFADACEKFLAGGWFCTDPQCELHFSKTIQYPVADYGERAAEISPCVTGCILVQECVACSPGKYHSWGDRGCRECPNGRYAHVAGLTACLECSSGASCERKDELPRALPAFFRWNGSTLNDGGVFDCTNDSSTPEVADLAFLRCRPVDVCVGGGCVGVNEGIGCRQCPQSYTYQGPGMGARWCRKCPGPFFMIGMVVSFVLIYAGLTLLFSRLGYWAAFGPGFLPCPFARAALHYFHLLGVAFEVTNLESRGNLRYALVGLDILYRPLDLLMFHCTDPDTNSETAIVRMSTMYKLLMVTGFVAIFAIFVVAFFYNLTKNVFVALWLTIRRGVRKKKPQKTKHVHSKQPKTEAEQAASGGHGAEHAFQGQRTARVTLSSASRITSKMRRGLARTATATSGRLAATATTTSRMTTNVLTQAVNQSGAGDLVDAGVGLGEVPEEPSSSSSSSSCNASEGSDGEEDGGVNFKRFSLIHGPGLNFTEHLESLALERDLRAGFIRVCFAWMLVSYPVCLRGIAMVLACDQFEPGNSAGRMVLNYDVVCQSEEQKRLIFSGGFSAFSSLYLGWTWCVLTPLLLWLYLYTTRDRLRQAMTRLKAAVLFDGYRSGMAWWEVFQFLRNGVIIMAAHDTPEGVRILLLILMVMGSFTLQYVMRPYETRCREFLQRFELLGLFGVFFTFCVGQLVSLEESERRDKAQTGRGILPGYVDLVHPETLGLVALFVNTVIVAYGLVMLFFNVYSMRIQAIIESGGSISTAAMKIHRLVQLYPGVSPVFYLAEGGTRYIDISQLTKHEKLTLARNVNDMVSVCIDNDTKFKLWVVERALDQAFRRALDSRKATLRRLYHTWGTKTFYIGHLFKAGLRAPDIQTPESLDEGMGVTVDELNDAMMDVINDILEFHPCIFGNPEQAARLSKAQSRLDEGRKAKEWSSQVVSVDSIFKEMKDMDDDGGLFDDDSADESTPTRRSKGLNNESAAGEETSNAFLDAVEEESRVYHEHREEALQLKKELSEKLQLLEEEYEELHQQLNQPSTTPSTADQLADATPLESTYRARDATSASTPAEPLTSRARSAIEGEREVADSHD